MQWAVTGLDYPAAAAWLTDVGKDPALSGVTISGVTQTQAAGRATVTFSSTATLTPEAKSDRASRLAKAAL